MKPPRNKSAFLIVVLLAAFLSFSSLVVAQDGQDAAPAAEEETHTTRQIEDIIADEQAEDEEPALPASMEDMPVVKLRSIDKVTARTVTFEANVGSTVKFGPLYIKVQACRKAPPIEQPESAAFLQIWQVSSEEKAEWVFSGWMFASSPGLSAMDHPVYDVWVLDCLAAKSDEAEEEQPAIDRGEGEIEEEQVPATPDAEGIEDESGE